MFLGQFSLSPDSDVVGHGLHVDTGRLGRGA